MSEKIEKLLEKIELKEMVLPEFQREYTWNRDQVKKLFVSLFKGYPTGSLLIWETSNPPKIKNDAKNNMVFFIIELFVLTISKVTKIR
jgi:uncharacterized protein with ParB-like and HNH nuclease domain